MSGSLCGRCQPVYISESRDRPTGPCRETLSQKRKRKQVQRDQEVQNVPLGCFSLGQPELEGPVQQFVPYLLPQELFSERLGFGGRRSSLSCLLLYHLRAPEHRLAGTFAFSASEDVQRFLALLSSQRLCLPGKMTELLLIISTHRLRVQFILSALLGERQKTGVHSLVTR